MDSNLTADGLPAFRRRLAAMLEKPLPGMDAWRTMLPPYRHGTRNDDRIGAGGLREASVLIALHAENDRIAFPLLVRSSELKHHAGQISLPGGSLEPGESPVEAALREMHEETGFVVTRGQVAGTLSDIVAAPSGYLVHPFVAVCEGPVGYHIDRNESVEVFDAYLDGLLDPANRSHFSRHWEGQDWTIPCFRLGGRIVWGLTAMILAEFAAVFVADQVHNMQKLCKNFA